MGLRGKLVAAIEFRAGGDVYHELFRDKPHEVANASPLVHGCQVHEGQFGVVGSVISWDYSDGDGKKKVAKEIIQKIDEEKKLIELKVIGGDLMEEFKDFLVTLHVETKDGIDMVTWTLEYEMLREDVTHPTTLLAAIIELTKHIEEYHAGKP